MVTKRIPLRTCLGCSTQKPKLELIRVVRSPSGDVSIDITGKKSGRGAYICKNTACLNKARKTKRIERLLGVKISDELYDIMTQSLDNSMID